MQSGARLIAFIVFRISEWPVWVPSLSNFRPLVVAVSDSHSARYLGFHGIVRIESLHVISAEEGSRRWYKRKRLHDVWGTHALHSLHWPGRDWRFVRPLGTEGTLDRSCP